MKPLPTARPDPHRQPSAGPKRRRLADLERVIGQPLERESLADRGRDDADLELAEAHPEADPRAAAERHVGAARDLLALALQEALGAEGVRLGLEVDRSGQRPRVVATFELEAGTEERAARPLIERLSAGLSR